MAGNSFGQVFRLTTFGESHGEAIGVVVDGCPSGIEMSIQLIQDDLDRRRPGQSRITTQRNEADSVKVLSGLFEGKTTGAPIAAIVLNQDHRSNDYANLASVFRPSHADFTYSQKYGHRDHRGGGRSSARETAARVIAGSIAKQVLARVGVEIQAYVSQVGRIEMLDAKKWYSAGEIEKNIVRCPNQSVAKQMIELIETVKASGDTIGGVVTGIIRGCPVGLGEPVFDKLHADLGKAMLSINAVKGFEYGDGFASAQEFGSQQNDLFVETTKKRGSKTLTSTNHSGGLQGGISNGMQIEFRVAFKPVATLLKSQSTVDIKGKKAIVKPKGRHDPCVVPRAVPIVEAMAAITILDHWLRNQAVKLEK